LAASAEKGSEHPLGEAIVRKAKEENLNLLDPKDFQAIAGYGIEATVDSKRILLGNLKLMDQRRVDLNGLSEKAEHLLDEGKTSMYLAINGKAIGILAVSDTLKENSKEAVEALQRMGLEVVMLTGDNQRPPTPLPVKLESGGSWQKSFRR